MNDTSMLLPQSRLVPGIQASLDQDHIPMALAIRSYRRYAESHPESEVVEIALERSNGSVSRWTERVLPEHTGYTRETLHHVERIVKFLLWARGAGTLHLAGPLFVTRHLAAQYSPSGLRSFDAELMSRAFGRPFEVKICGADDLPRENENATSIGGYLDGCRVGFDLGASDFKLAATHDGEVLYSAEIPWNPVIEKDPAYHISTINAGIKMASSHLPRIDAIGGSAAGIYIDNRVMVASLFRSVPEEAFLREIRPMFERMAEESGVPVTVVNDGDVTALAGAMSMDRKPLLGIAMGSSEAAGYIDADGHIRGWLNELAFSPIDLNPEASLDEWSGDRGVGARYFSQQAVARLAKRAGFLFSNDMMLPEQLREVQLHAATGDNRALRIFETIGTYLGYALLLYQEFYDFSDVLILGRVTSGIGGEIIIDHAKCVLTHESDMLKAPVFIHVPDEKNRRVGQAVAAASLPKLC